VPVVGNPPLETTVRDGYPSLLATRQRSRAAPNPPEHRLLYGDAYLIRLGGYDLLAFLDTRSIPEHREAARDDLDLLFSISQISDELGGER